MDYIEQNPAERPGARYLTLLERPVKIPAYAVKQHWHARYHRDLGNRWLRGACAELFSVPRRSTSHVRAYVTRLE